MKPSKETRRAEGRDQPGGIPRVEARVRTQSRAALPPNLARVNAAAQQAGNKRLHAFYSASSRIGYRSLQRRGDNVIRCSDSGLTEPHGGADGPAARSEARRVKGTSPNRRIFMRKTGSHQTHWRREQRKQTSL